MVNFRLSLLLRHHYATSLASSGEVDLYVLQRLLTHATPTMTQRYSHLTDAALQRAVRAAENIVATAKDQSKSADEVALA